MHRAEIIHAVLEIAHIAEEVFGHFGGGFDGSGWGQWGPVERVGAVSYGGRRCGMSDEVGGDHDEEKSCCYREGGEEIGVKTDECTDSEEGEGMDGFSPGKKTNKASLEDEDDTNTTT